MTADLQAVTRDAHLVLVVPRTDRPARAASSSSPPEQPPIGKAGWFAPGVAYIEFRGFLSNKETLTKFREFLDSHSRARALIIDTVNGHSGDWVGEADLRFSELSCKSRDLVAIDIPKAVDDCMGGLATGPSIRKS